MKEPTKLIHRTGIYCFALILATLTASAVFVRPAIAATTVTSVANTTAPAPSSYTLEQLPDKVNYHDFVVGPGKIELQLSPGQSQVVDLTVANRLGSDKIFSITEEDFKGSNDPSQPVILLGSDRGPYSLKDDASIPATNISIPFSSKAHIPITVTVPANAQPGAFYGSVLVSVVSSVGTTTSTGVGASNPIITRIGTLFFVRVPGPVEADGQLTGFSISNGSVVWSSSLSKTSPIFFDILFKNTGDVYLAPYGTITVTNIFGSTVANATVDPWFAMPQSLRFREVEWDPAFLFGRYTAHVSINRGYVSTSTATDTADIVFWVIPWEIILLVFIGLAVFIGLIRWIFSKFSIVAKK
jgi:hypothetical protein